MTTWNFLLGAALAMSPLLSHSTIWRVNNLGYSADFTALQSAIDSAGAGDTLHVEASTTSYGYVTVDRPLVFIGPGYKLGQSASDNPELQANAQMATLGGIVLAQFSEGTVIQGLRFNGNFEGIAFTTGTGNYIIRRCFFDGVGITFGLNSVAVSNVLITQCYMHSFALTAHPTALGQSNVFITNNYIYGYIANWSTQASDWTIAHNVINWNLTSQFYDAVVKDNVFDGLASVPVNNNDIHDNIARNANILPTGNNNLNSQNLALHYPAAGSDDGKWDLLSGSTFNNWGSDSTDVGMYGGATPYRRSGIPAIPAIYLFRAPTTAIEGDPLEVTLSTRSNN